MHDQTLTYMTKLLRMHDHAIGLHGHGKLKKINNSICAKNSPTSLCLFPR